MTPQPASPGDGASTSESEEMYLITVARAVEDGTTGPVPIPHLAAALGVTQVAANEMVKKLASREFLEYVPYRGVTLTARGIRIAEGVLRRRRLWGVFLSEHLGLSAEQADEVACEFEHVTPEEVERRLAEFLGDPSVGPRGRRIPTGSSDAEEAPPRRLADVEVGASAQLGGIPDDPAVGSFLTGEGIGVGTALTVIARSNTGAVLVRCGDSHVALAADLADRIRVG